MMKILVWVCRCCNSRKCILPFTGTKNSCGFERPDVCIEDVSCWTDPWVLRRMEDADIIKYFADSNKKYNSGRVRQ